MKTRVKNVKATYLTRSVLGGAKIKVLPKQHEAARNRREYQLDSEGYFVWTRGTSEK